MTRIEQIQLAIGKAMCHDSKLTPLALAVPALSAINIRHLMNNLGAISTKYLEHGVHKGGLYCSTIFKNDNLTHITAVDSWESDAINEDKAYPQFIDNVSVTKPTGTVASTIISDSFFVSPDQISGPIDLYLFDADHSEDSQCRALTHFLPAMADQFIFCVDDWDFPEVSAGTRRGLEESSVEILFEKIFKGNDHDNNNFWNGYGVFLLKKKP